MLVAARPGHKDVVTPADVRLRLAQAAFPDDDVRARRPRAHDRDARGASRVERPGVPDRRRRVLRLPLVDGARTRCSSARGSAVATRPGFPRERLETRARAARPPRAGAVLRHRAAAGGVARPAGRLGAGRTSAGDCRPQWRPSSTARCFTAAAPGYTESQLSPIEQARRIAALVQDKLARDVVILDMRPVCTYTDYFVVCTGNNERQTKAIFDEVHARLKKDNDLLPRAVEGATEATWIIADYLDVVLHVFTPRRARTTGSRSCGTTSRRRRSKRPRPKERTDKRSPGATVVVGADDESEGPIAERIAARSSRLRVCAVRRAIRPDFDWGRCPRPVQVGAARDVIAAVVSTAQPRVRGVRAARSTCRATARRDRLLSRRAVVNGRSLALHHANNQQSAFTGHGLRVRATIALLRAHSSAGRAPPWHGGGRRFEPDWVHCTARSAHCARRALFLLASAAERVHVAPGDALGPRADVRDRQPRVVPRAAAPLQPGRRDRDRVRVEVTGRAVRLAVVRARLALRRRRRVPPPVPRKRPRARSSRPRMPA